MGGRTGGVIGLRVCSSTEVFLNRISLYSLPPCTNQIRSAPFYIENIIHFFTKQAILMRRSTVLSLPFHLVFPGVPDKFIRASLTRASKAKSTLVVICLPLVMKIMCFP